MAGNIRGKIEAYSNTGSLANTTQEAFKGLYDFFAAHPSATIVAMHCGLGSASDWTNYWDHATKPFMTNAWFVVKMAKNAVRLFDYYVLVQWANTATNFGASPGDPGLIFGNPYAGYGKIGIQVAIGEGGDENPWNGTGVFGQNTKGATVWKVPDGGTRRHVFPRSNNPGGTHDSLKQNCVGVNESSITTWRWHVVADDDNWLVAFDTGDNGSYCMIGFFMVTPRSGLTVPYPCLMLYDSDAVLAMTSLYGTTAGTSTSQEGGIIMPITSDGMKGLILDRVTSAVSVTYQPNKLFAVPEYDEFPLAVFASETATFYGFVGMLEWIREVGNIAWKDTDLALLRHMIGATGTGIKLSMPWDGATVPGTGVARAGVDFVRAP